MGSNYRLNYGVDLVFCIDATGSMDHILDTVKQNALNFYDDFKEVMEEKKKHVSQLRIRVIAFRDYLEDQDKAMLLTDFFTLPDEAEAFRSRIQCIEAEGGGDDPEDGLEAIAYAIKNSKWSFSSEKRRHVIVVWSDEGTHPLGYGSSSPYYPSNIAKDFDELTAWWGTKTAPGIMDENAKRLVMFTPNKPGWSTIRANWNKALMCESEAGSGLDKLNYETILDIISNTI